MQPLGQIQPVKSCHLAQRVKNLGWVSKDRASHWHSGYRVSLGKHIVSNWQAMASLIPVASAATCPTAAVTHPAAATASRLGLQGTSSFRSKVLDQVHVAIYILPSCLCRHRHLKIGFSKLLLSCHLLLWAPNASLVKSSRY